MNKKIIIPIALLTLLSLAVFAVTETTSINKVNCVGCTDINGNGLVEPTDAIYVTNRLGKCTEDSGYDFKADINGNSCIGEDDNQCVIDQLGNAAACSSCTGCADINGNGVIDPTDAIYVTNRIGKCTGDSDYDFKADINGNGCIGVDDNQCIIDQLGDEATCTPNSDPPGCIDKCGDNICQENVCVGGNCPCDETISNCPVDCKNNECTTEQDCINIGKCNAGLECTCSNNKCFAGYVVESDTAQQEIIVESDTAQQETDVTEPVGPGATGCGRGTTWDETQNKCNPCLEGTTPSLINSIWQCLLTGPGPAADCPESCVCDRDAISCPSEDEAVTVIIQDRSKRDEDSFDERISSSGGGGSGVKGSIEEMVISIGKTSSGTSLKQGDIEVTTTQKLNVMESKVYLETSSGTEEIKVLPEEVASKTTIQSIDEIEITEENGKAVYSISGSKEGKFIFIIPISIKITQKISAETGEIISTEKPWWSFLTSGI